MANGELCRDREHKEILCRMFIDYVLVNVSGTPLDKGKEISNGHQMPALWNRI